MKLVNRLLASFMILVFSSSSVFSSLEQEKRLAFSKKHGVEVFASGENWCGETANIILKSERTSFFSEDELKLFVVKIGKAVLSKECPNAQRALVSGYGNDLDQVIYKGTAEKEQDWKLIDAQLKKGLMAKLDVKGNRAVQSAKPEILGQPEKEEKKVKLLSKEKRDHQEQSEAEIKITKTGLKTTDETVMITTTSARFDEIAGYLPLAEDSPIKFNEADIDTIMTVDGCSIRLPKGFVQAYRLDIDSVFGFTEGDFICELGVLQGSGSVAIKTFDASVDLITHTGKVIDGFLVAQEDEWKPQFLFKDPGFRNRYVMFSHISYKPELKTYALGLEDWYNGEFKKLAVIGLTDRDSLQKQHNYSRIARFLDGLHDKYIRTRKNHSAELLVYDDIESLEPALKISAGPKSNYAEKRYRITNLLQERELKRQEEEKKQKEIALMKELQRKMRMKADYKRFSSMDKLELKQQILGQHYTAFTKKQYLFAAQSALKLKENRSRWMIHVTDISDDEIDISYPLEMEGTSKELKQTGWYIVEASISGELGETNNSGYIQPRMDNITIESSCTTEMCDNFSDPIEAVRQKYQQMDWLPEKDSKE